MTDHLRKVHSDEEISAAGYNRLIDAVNMLLSLLGPGGLEGFRAGGSISLRRPQQPAAKFWARLDSSGTLSGTMVFAWTEMDLSTGGAFSVLTGGRTGTTAVNPAYEIHGKSVLANGTVIVEMQQGYLNSSSVDVEYLFDAGSAVTINSPLTIEDASGTPTLTNINQITAYSATGVIITSGGPGICNLQIAAASTTQMGAVTTGAQTLGGQKTFHDTTYVGTGYGWVNGGAGYLPPTPNLQVSLGVISPYLLIDGSSGPSGASTGWLTETSFASDGLDFAELVFSCQLANISGRPSGAAPPGAGMTLDARGLALTNNYQGDPGKSTFGSLNGFPAFGIPNGGGWGQYGSLSDGSVVTGGIITSVGTGTGTSGSLQQIVGAGWLGL